MKPNGLPRMCLALTMLVLGHPREARGTPDDPTAIVPAVQELAPSVEYDAPADCPSRSEFFDLVAARGVTLQDSTHVPTLSIAITRTSQQFVGRLATKDSAGSSGARQVVSSTCAEVADALAVVTAIAARDARQTAEEATSTAFVDTAPHQTTDEPPPSTPEQKDSSSERKSEAPPEPHFRYVAGGRPDWMRPGELHHETDVPEGKLSLDLKLALDVQAGASLGLLPGLAVPRYDLALRNVIFITPPGQDPFMLGVVPRIRLSFFNPTTLTSNGVSSEFAAFQFSMGSCLTPYYDDRGLVLLGCAEYGGSAAGVRSTDGSRKWEQSLGAGVLSVTLEGEYNFSSSVHLALRTGWEIRAQGDQVVETADGDELFELGGSSLFATVGLGVHF